MADEMDNHYERWEKSYESNGVHRPGLFPWLNNIEKIKTFAYHRPEAITFHVQSYFQLNGTYRLNISSNDVSSGRVRVNDLLIGEPTWSGTYFKNIPVSLTAIPSAGFLFSHWEGDIQSSEKIIELNSTENVTISPVFVADNP